MRTDLLAPERGELRMRRGFVESGAQQVPPRDEVRVCRRLHRSHVLHVVCTIPGFEEVAGTDC